MQNAKGLTLEEVKNKLKRANKKISSEKRALIEKLIKKMQKMLS